MTRFTPWLTLAAVVMLLAACADDGANGSAERATAVTIAWPEIRQVERVESSVGRLDAAVSPSISAETAGRVAVVHRDAGDRVAAGELLAELDAGPQRIALAAQEAEVRQLDAQLANQRVQLERLNNLAERQSVARDQLDQARTQVQVLEARLDEARAGLAEAELNLERTRLLSPVSGRVQARHISAGDFVTAGRAVFELVAPDALRAVLPLPEHLQDELFIGQTVRLTVPSRPDAPIEQAVTELKPRVGAGSRAIELVVDLDNPGGWRPGGSVSGQVVTDRRDAVVVPLAAVVRRPSGAVVYVAGGDQRADERRVETGLRGADWIEIRAGLDRAEPVVVDGAAFLTDRALLDVRDGLVAMGEATAP